MILPVTIFLAMVAYLPSVLSATIVGRWVVLSLGMGALLLTLPRPLLGPGHRAAAMLFLWASLSLIWSVSPFDTLGELLHWLVLGVLFLTASQYRNPEMILVAVVLGLCVSLSFALIQMQGAIPVLVTDVPGGLFLSRNALGEIAAVALVWALLRRAWAFVLPPFILVVLSSSRGALLACLVGGLYWMWGTQRNRWAVIPVILSFVVGGLFVTWYRDSSLEAIYLRLDMWNLTLSNLTFLGYGLNTFAALAPQYEFSHNDTLQLAFELGIGALFGLPVLAYAIRRQLPEAGALLSLTAASMVSFPLHHPMGAALMAILSGYCCGVNDRARRGECISRVGASARVQYESEYRTADLRRAIVSRASVANRS